MKFAPNSSVLEILSVRLGFTISGPSSLINKVAGFCFCGITGFREN